MQPNLHKEGCHLLQPPSVDKLPLPLPLDFYNHCLCQKILELGIYAVPKDLQPCLEQWSDLLVLYMVPIEVAEDLPHPIDEDFMVLPCPNQRIQQLCACKSSEV
jgi:hypothetical protein